MAPPDSSGKSGDDSGDAVELPYTPEDPLLAHGRTLLAVVSPGGELLRIAPGAQGVLGLDPRKLLGTTFAELLDDEDRPRFEQVLERSVRTHRRGRFLHGLDWSGGRRQCETLLTPFRGPEGLQVHLATTDLSHHLAQIGHLETAQALFHAVLEAAGDAIFGVDGHLRIVTASHRAQALFGIDPAELTGRDLRELFMEPEVLDAVVSAIQRVTGAPLRMEALARAFDGRPFPVELSASAAELDHSTLGTVVLRDITDRRRLESALREAATTDVLTGLPNRSAFMRELQQMLVREPALALLFIDLDHFKPVNDRLGHAAGDELLQQVAARIQHGVRGTDLVARLGGDEFVALLPGVSEAGDALRVADSVVSRLARPFSLEAGVAEVTCSVGVALAPTHAQGASELLACADAAMYAAKDAGRNRSRLADGGG